MLTIKRLRSSVASASAPARLARTPNARRLELMPSFKHSSDEGILDIVLGAENAGGG